MNVWRWAVTATLTGGIVTSNRGAVEETDYFGQPRRSPVIAAAMSGVLPGTGQLYVGSKRGVVYLVAEAGFLVAHVVTKRDAESLRDSYLREVRANVKFDGPGSFDRWTMEDFEHATLFDNWHNIYTEENGQPLERVGKFYWKDREDFKDVSPASGNPLPPSELRQVALEYRNRSNDRFKAATTFVGLLLFNHLVSAVDAMATARRERERKTLQHTSLHIEPERTPAATRLRLLVRHVF